MFAVLGVFFVLFFGAKLSKFVHLEGTFVHTCTFGAPPFVEQISKEQQDLEESDIYLFYVQVYLFNFYFFFVLFPDPFFGGPLPLLFNFPSFAIRLSLFSSYQVGDMTSSLLKN